MKRRHFVLGLGSLATAGSAALGTGAFTSVDAERRLDVEVAGDNQALLKLTQLGDGQGFGARSIQDDTPNEVAFSFPGAGERLADPSVGLGTDSVYEFDRDAGESDNDESVEGLLRIENQGTQPVVVYSEHETESSLEVELYDVEDSSETALRDNPADLDVGDSVDVGFRIRTFGAEVRTFRETLTIVAEALDD